MPDEEYQAWALRSSCLCFHPRGDGGRGRGRGEGSSSLKKHVLVWDVPLLVFICNASVSLISYTLQAMILGDSLCGILWWSSAMFARRSPIKPTACPHRPLAASPFWNLPAGAG